MKQNEFSFQDLKKRSATELTRVRQAIPFKVGDWKRTRLKTALGQQLAKATLLDDDTHQEHAERMAQRFETQWGHLTKGEIQDDLRFLTILDRVVPVDLETMVQACESLEAVIKDVLTSESRHIEMIGCVEMEVVNLSYTKKKVSETTPSTQTPSGIDQGAQVQASSIELDEDGNEQRKLNVLQKMVEQASGYSLPHRTDETQSWVLIHFHGLVHLGGPADGKNALCERVVTKLRSQWTFPYAVVLKRTFRKQGKQEKFRKVADYITKCGNEELRYVTRFGRGMSSADIEARALWKQGYRGDDTLDDGKETSMEDSVSLTVGEVEALGKAIYRLMERKSLGEGYIMQL